MFASTCKLDDLWTYKARGTGSVSVLSQNRGLIVDAIVIHIVLPVSLFSIRNPIAGELREGELTYE